MKNALEKASIESVETGASEILRRWDFESLASGDKQAHSGDTSFRAKTSNTSRNACAGCLRKPESVPGE